MESEKESEKEQIKESLEEQALLLNTTKVVEYLVPFMSSELLCKFPDNSAYDFDYTQSTIWSPLVPRPYNNASMDLDLVTPRKLSYDMDLGARSSVKKLRKKLTSSAFKKYYKSRKNNNKMGSEFSSTPPKFKGACCNPIMNKVTSWMPYSSLREMGKVIESCLKTVQEMEGKERPHYSSCDAFQVFQR